MIVFISLFELPVIRISSTYISRIVTVPSMNLINNEVSDIAL